MLIVIIIIQTCGGPLLAAHLLVAAACTKRNWFKHVRKGHLVLLAQGVVTGFAQREHLLEG